VQAATNGIEFAKSADYAKKAAEPPLRYLQPTHGTRPSRTPRREPLRRCRRSRTLRRGRGHRPVITIVNGVNNEQVGRVIESARQPEEDQLLSFQPVSFTGRDEEITDDAVTRSAIRCRTW
jgi:uncharacterized radical SAM superfamily Fe-S cluster-containing enzyme